MTKDNGGPAFPAKEFKYFIPKELKKDECFMNKLFNCLGVNHHLCQGMTLRDYFAGKAVGGMLSDRAYQEGVVWPASKNDPDELARVAARESYRIADAMLKEREK